MGNETDLISLLEFKSKMAADPYGILSSWNDSVNFCKWHGITCSSKHHRVASLKVQGMSLSGTISPYTGNLTFLSGENSCRARLFKEACYTFPQFKQPHWKDPTFCWKNLSSLQRFSVASNHMEGNIPNEMGRITSLTLLAMGDNNLVGSIPSTLYNISSIAMLSVTQNQLQGKLPANIGLTLPNLQIFEIGMNQFHGSVPVSWTNASVQLEIFDVYANSFTGQVPIDRGNLNGLQLLNLGNNFLGNNSSQDLAFITSLSNCTNLRGLSLSDNNFGGVLPSTIVNMSTLMSITLGRNQISGRIPAYIGILSICMD
ncbi:putative receptor-like protein kinase At3g47110 [Hevea brasiliensis]|uniref:putative receptor-like protein kinase At3g47110 n=1 Tax=Hevea brasiliensis TaxID=3981 RepID=UPI0025ED9152|nr:putative receptor-like protein kinase At3g47110 [Hevea brasiliensis]